MGMADVRYPGGGAAFELPGYDVEIVPLDHADSTYYYFKADFQKWKGRQFVFLVMATLTDPVNQRDVVTTKASTFWVNGTGTSVSMSRSNDATYPGGTCQYVPFVYEGAGSPGYEYFVGTTLGYDAANDYISFKKNLNILNGTPVSCVALRITKA